MKYPIIIFFILSFNFSPALNGQIKIGIGAGGQATSMLNMSSGSFIPNLVSSIALPYVGVSLTHPLSKKVSLSLEGDLVSGEYFFEKDKVTERNWQELHYTLIHNSAIFRHQIGKNCSIGTGLMFYYLGPTKSRVKLFPISGPSYVSEQEFDSSIGYGIPLSFGYQFKKFFLDLQWNYGFKSRERTVYGKLQTFSLGLFYQFELNRK